MQVTYETDRKDFLPSLAIIRRIPQARPREFWAIMVLLAFAVVLAGAGVALISYQHDAMNWHLLWRHLVVIAPALLLGGVIGLSFAALMLFLASLLIKKERITISLTPEGVRRISPTAEAFIAWNNISTIFLDPTGLLLNMKSPRIVKGPKQKLWAALYIQAILIPARAFDSAAEAEKAYQIALKFRTAAQYELVVASQPGDWPPPPQPGKESP